MLSNTIVEAYGGVPYIQAEPLRGSVYSDIARGAVRGSYLTSSTRNPGQVIVCLVESTESGLMSTSQAHPTEAWVEALQHKVVTPAASRGLFDLTESTLPGAIRA